MPFSSAFVPEGQYCPDNSCKTSVNQVLYLSWIEFWFPENWFVTGENVGISIKNEDGLIL